MSAVMGVPKVLARVLVAGRFIEGAGALHIRKLDDDRTPVLDLAVQCHHLSAAHEIASAVLRDDGRCMLFVLGQNLRFMHMAKGNEVGDHDRPPELKAGSAFGCNRL
jgi:hypothetical protein